MRKFLLASVATLGTGGLMGAAFAQVPAGTPTQGQTAYPLANPLASANTNNNYQAPAIPGALANPTPGTIVVHINGKVQTTFQSEWGSADTHQITATAAQAAISGNSTVAPAGSDDQKVLDIYRNNCETLAAAQNDETQGWPQFIAEVGSIGSDSEPTGIIFAGQRTPPVRQKH
jgi:uncharacterized membrane protein